MSPLLTPSKAMLAIALALSTTVAAHAQTASATASVGNLKIQLIDLDPDDGIAAKLTLASADQVYQYADARLYSSDSNLSESDYRYTRGTTSVALDSIEASASASSDASVWEAASSYANPVGGNLDVASTMYGSFQFKLTRATRMIITADASVTGEGDGRRNKTEATARINGWFDDGLEKEVIDGLSWAGTDADKQLGISMQTLYGSLYGWIRMETDTRVTYDAAAPVPEPSTYAMMLAGLAVLGGYARKKARPSV